MKSKSGNKWTLPKQASGLVVSAQLVSLKEVTYKQFKEFLDSLDEERKTWSLDLQNYKNDKEFYESGTYAIVCIYDKEVIGLCSCYRHIKNLNQEMIEVSFVVKKDYQSQGIGTTLLKRVEWDMSHTAKKHKYITAKHYKDNIASHKAFLKADYKEMVNKDDDLHNWKIKQIG